VAIYFFLLEFNYTDVILEMKNKIKGSYVAREKSSTLFLLLAVSRAVPQLTDRLEQADLFLLPHVPIIFRPKSFSGRDSIC